MLSFASDYLQGAHPAILEALARTNDTRFPGYGSDAVCASAADKIRAACACPNAEVFFITGGTQTNQLTIDTVLQPWQGVLSAETGHVGVHEAGAIEFTGHKVLTLPQHSGKIDAKELAAYIDTFYKDGNHEHMVFPGMVYISHPTEYGTLYSLAELTAISEVCRAQGIPLYMDGARLGYGLMSDETDVDLPAIARLCDVFYIGGTKVGALFGEALVFSGIPAPAHFVNQIKKHGALLAKGWLNGLQFDTLFTDGLYFRISRSAIECANKMKQGLRELGLPFLLDSPTNQQFVILPNDKLKALDGRVGYSFWETVDAEHTAVRFASSWATTPEQVDELLAILREVLL